MAVTADGKIDTVARRGARISGASDSARVDALRAEADAILVGGRTLLAEDPRLTVRDPALVHERRAAGRSEQPTKVGVTRSIGPTGGNGGLPVPSRFLSEGGARVVIATTVACESAVVDDLTASGAEVLLHPGMRVDLALLLEQLRQAGIEHLMVEGGGTIVAAFLAAGLVDEVQLAYAPLIFGGADAPTPVSGPGFGADEAIHLNLVDVDRSIDGDIVARYQVQSR